MPGFVAVDCDVPESGSREMCLQFIGGVGVHTLDHLLPFLVIAGEVVVLIDYEELPTWNKDAPHFGEAIDDVRPEIYGLESSGHGECGVSERKARDAGFQHLATAFDNRVGIDLPRFLN